MSTPLTQPDQRPRTAFTLVELLVVISMIGILTAIIVPAASSLQQAADATTSIAAARRTTQAWRSWSTDREGRLMCSQLDSGTPLSASEAPTHHGGAEIPDIARRRWLWRLYAYLEDPVQTIWSGGQRTWWDAVMDGGGDMSSKLYVATLHPSMGLNGEWIGGRHSGESDTFALTQYMQSQDPLATPLYAETLAQLRNPAKLVLFASARGADNASGGQPIEGWWRIEPPYRPGVGEGQPSWTQTDSGGFAVPDTSTDPGHSGFVSARHGGRTVTAAPDGSARLEKFEQLGDMRRWANEAVSPTWSPSF
ncbi:MAG: type II secretion system GspH family protein [Phycisphaerales bacterium]|nr:type II secretion system GspH family protein [Phycisphaerales bacterium]